MAHMNRLTAAELRSLLPREKSYTISDGGGLTLHIAPDGRKKFLYRYTIAGKKKNLTLGYFPKMTLAQAREQRDKYAEQVQQGKNPKEEKKQVAVIESPIVENTFEAIAREWMDTVDVSPAHLAAVRGSLESNVFPVIGNIPIDQLTPPDILSVIRVIEERGAYEMAHKVLTRIGQTCRYAVQTGKALYNPAAEMRGALRTRPVEHMRMIEKEELPQYFSRLSTCPDHIVVKAALRFQLLTASRPGETRLAVWNEIDWEEKMWRIPAARMKMRRPHNVPLNRQALTILQAMKAHAVEEENGFIFPGIRNPHKPLSDGTVRKCLRSMGFKATPHGFRSTFSTITNEIKGFDPDAIERQLAHADKNAVRGAYHRSEYNEERRRMMTWWGDWLEAIESAGELVPAENYLP